MSFHRFQCTADAGFLSSPRLFDSAKALQFIDHDQSYVTVLKDQILSTCDSSPFPCDTLDGLLTSVTGLQSHNMSEEAEELLYGFVDQSSLTSNIFHDRSAGEILDFMAQSTEDTTIVSTAATFLRLYDVVFSLQSVTRDATESSDLKDTMASTLVQRNDSRHERINRMALASFNILLDGISEGSLTQTEALDAAIAIVHFDASQSCWLSGDALTNFPDGTVITHSDALKGVEAMYKCLMSHEAENFGVGVPFVDAVWNIILNPENPSTDPDDVLYIYHIAEVISNFEGLFPDKDTLELTASLRLDIRTQVNDCLHLRYDDIATSHLPTSESDDHITGSIPLFLDSTGPIPTPSLNESTYSPIRRLRANLREDPVLSSSTTTTTTTITTTFSDPGSQPTLIWPWVVIGVICVVAFLACLLCIFKSKKRTAKHKIAHNEHAKSHPFEPVEISSRSLSMSFHKIQASSQDYIRVPDDSSSSIEYDYYDEDDRTEINSPRLRKAKA